MAKKIPAGEVPEFLRKIMEALEGMEISTSETVASKDKHYSACKGIIEVLEKHQLCLHEELGVLENVKMALFQESIDK